MAKVIVKFVALFLCLSILFYGVVFIRSEYGLGCEVFGHNLVYVEEKEPTETSEGICICCSGECLKNCYKCLCCEKCFDITMNELENCEIIILFKLGATVVPTPTIASLLPSLTTAEDIVESH